MTQEKKQYPKNLVAAMKRGVEPPMNGRVLLRAVTMQEIHGERTGLVLREGDLREVAYHEIVSVADDVEGKFFPGDLVLHVSAAADLANHLDEDCPYILVPAKHILFAVDREEALGAEQAESESIEAKKEHVRRVANGLVT